jgi:hypothetical protein
MSRKRRFFPARICMASLILSTPNLSRQYVPFDHKIVAGRAKMRETLCS